MTICGIFFPNLDFLLEPKMECWEEGQKIAETSSRDSSCSMTRPTALDMGAKGFLTLFSADR
jgi:hypothetical protein